MSIHAQAAHLVPWSDPFCPARMSPPLPNTTQLDTLVTVVDAERFVSSVLEAESLKDKGMAVDEDDDRTVADLLVEQVGAFGGSGWRGRGSAGRGSRGKGPWRMGRRSRRAPS